MPKYCSKISVGMVHTFQSAERKIIILSTVYGKQDGCFFSDANKSLMNVAVSRAKDNFFVFGDINCLKDTQGSASGLFKKCVISNRI
jgi:superfamily I DNA and/or RNA helicase